MVYSEVSSSCQLYWNVTLNDAISLLSYPNSNVPTALGHALYKCVIYLGAGSVSYDVNGSNI